MPPDPRPSRWPSFAARSVGLWILAGCLAKALLGTPGDLPPLVRRVPLALGPLFSLAIGIEAFVGLATALRPGRAWPLALLLLLAFGAVLTSQIAEGASSCGCFGGRIDVPPWAMLALDVAFLALLLAARPWRLARGGRGDLLVGVLALAAGLGLPWLTDREVEAGKEGSGLGRPYTVLDPRAWTGQPLAATPLAPWIDPGRAEDGVWILYSETCEHCALCLERMTMSETRGAEELTLVRLSQRLEPGVEPKVQVLPEGPYVHTIELPDTRDWLANVPVRLRVKDGVVVSAEEKVEPDSCR